jgi:hypothetical protein
MKSINLPDRIPYRKGRFWGYCNEKGEIVIDCKYEVVCFFSEGLARVRSILKWSIIDKNGSTITKYDYTDLQDYQEGLAAVRRNDKWGYINRLGKEIIRCTYSKAFSFNQGLARVKNSENHKWGFIDSHQNIIVEFNYDEATDFQNGVAKVRLNDRWGIVNKFGILICPCIYLEIVNFKDNLSIVKKQIEDESYYGVIDINGQEVVPSQMDYITINNFISCNHDNIIYRHYGSFNCHKVFGSENQINCYSGRFNILETSDHFYYLIAENDLNKTPISNYYNGIRPAFENVAISSRDGKYGLLDKTGKEIVPPIYLKLEKFSDEYFIAMNDEGFFGLLEKNGKTSMPHKFTYISRFSKNLFIVSDTKEKIWTGDYYNEKSPCWLVYKNGRELNNIKYDFIGNLSEEFSQLATVRRNEMFGLINQNGDEIVECIYSDLFGRITDNLMLAKKEEGYGIINVNGEEIVKCIYTNLRKEREYSICYVSRIVETSDNSWLNADGYVDFEGNEYWEGTKSDWIYQRS